MALSTKIVVWGNIINLITSGLTNYNFDLIRKDIIRYVIYHFSLSLMIVISNSFLRYIQFVYSEYFSKDITLEILNKAMEIDIIHYDNSETYDLIKKASQNSLNRNISFLSNITETFKSIFIVISLSIIIFNFNKLLLIGCFVMSIPLFYIDNRFTNELFGVFNLKFENLRFIEYLKDLMLNHSNIKDMKIMGSFLYINT